MKIEDITKLDSEKARTFILDHISSNPSELLLKYHGKTDLPLEAIAEQVSCKKKAEKKLATFNKLGFIY